MITSTPTFGRDVDEPDADVADPADLLRRWLPDNAAELRPLMTLATIDADGRPDARSVLLSLFDDHGVHFHTNASTRKAAQLAARPVACAALAWPDVGRQVVVAGPVEPEDPVLSARVYATRGAYLRELAWVNTDELARRPLGERRAAWARFAGAHPDPTLTPPPSWLGLVLCPQRYTFWRGDEAGPSNRVEYRLGDDGWTVHRLAG